jgi:hypothetical protein
MTAVEEAAPSTVAHAIAVDRTCRRISGIP